MEFDLAGEENEDFLKFLDGKSQKFVKLDRIFGIGGEGVVLKDQIWTREFDYKTEVGRKEKKELAVKFVRFTKTDEDNFDDPEYETRNGDFGGINENGRFVSSKYFDKLYQNLGDFAAATHHAGGYNAVYADFGISEIHEKFYYLPLI